MTEYSSVGNDDVAAEPADEGLTVVTEPVRGSGTAGVGVIYKPDAAGPTTPVRVAQLWPLGDTEQVHVPEEDLGDLIYALMRVHLAVMDGEGDR